MLCWFSRRLARPSFSHTNEYTHRLERTVLSGCVGDRTTVQTVISFVRQHQHYLSEQHGGSLAEQRGRHAGEGQCSPEGNCREEQEKSSGWLEETEV